MEDQVTTGAAEVEHVREVDRIRDIIFGGNMRDYERRFDDITRELARLQSAVDDLNNRLAQQDNSQASSLQAAVADLNTRLAQQDGAQSANLQTAVDSLNACLAKQDSAQAASLKAAQRQLQQAHDDLRDELHASAQQLALAKTDRMSLGDLLIELAKQLQANGAPKGP